MMSHVIVQHWLLRWIVVAHPKAEPLLSRAHADFLWGVAVLLSFKFVQGDSLAMSFAIDACCCCNATVFQNLGATIQCVRISLGRIISDCLGKRIECGVEKGRPLLVMWDCYPVPNLYDPASVCKMAIWAHPACPAGRPGRPQQTELRVSNL